MSIAKPLLRFFLETPNEKECEGTIGSRFKVGQFANFIGENSSEVDVLFASLFYKYITDKKNIRDTQQSLAYQQAQKDILDFFTSCYAEVYQKKSIDNKNQQE